MSSSKKGSPLDTAFEAAKRILEAASINIAQIQTEEDAKVQIITRLLTESLGWSFSDVGTERKHDNGFSDYVLSDSEHVAMLLEAKRIGQVNIRAQEKDRLRTYKISGPALVDVIPGIEQAASYAAPNGIPSLIIVTGKQIGRAHV